VLAVSRPRRLAIPLLLALALGAAACGGSRRQADVTAPPLGSATGPAASAPATTPTTTAQASTTPAATTPRTTPTTTTPSTTPTTSSSSQGTGGAQAGCAGGAVGGFIRDVQAAGTDCGRAKDVANAWFAAVHGGAAPDSQISAVGYACGATMAGERASVTCSGAGGSKVTFTASP
jgi:hypothetical protein